MKYLKPPLSFSDQADLLIGRGLIVTDKADLISKLEAVSYYRLSAYWHPFRQPGNTLKSGTTLDMIWRRYTFDRQLRLLVMDAIERIEVAVRTQLVNRHTMRYGAFGYLNRNNLPGISVPDHRQMLEQIHEATARSRERLTLDYP